MNDLRAMLRALWQEALAAASPGPLVREALQELPRELAARPRYLIAAGKAAYSMLEGASAAGGWVEAVAVGPELERARFLATPADPRRGRVLALAGAHPVPDASSVAAAEQLRALVGRAPEDALLVALVSGGASAMVAKPRAGLTLAEKVARTSRRMAEGAPIAELNALRRSLSAVKGGQLIAAAAAPVLSLVVSDVAGDDPRVVASGLTVSAPAHPLRGSTGSSPPAPGSRVVVSGARTMKDEAGEDLSAGLGPELEETAAPWREAREADRVEILARQDAVARAAAQGLRERGWEVTFLEGALVGDVEDAARILTGAVAGAKEQWPERRRAFVAYGEPVVVLPEGAGAGGRAQQLALLLARAVARWPVTALVAGTDGVDGPSTPAAAGAVVDGETWAAIQAAGVDGAAALARCDARAALEAVAQLLVTGPTGINHADVMILLYAP